MLAAFAVTPVAGLAVAFGGRRFVTALLLNLWFIVALGLAFNLHPHTRVTTCTWTQAAAWAAGSALWISVTFLGWVLHRRQERPQPVAELPGDTSPRKPAAPVVAFAVVRAAVIAGTVALTFGLNLSHGYWLPIAAMVAMKPSLQQATLVAVPRTGQPPKDTGRQCGSGNTPTRTLALESELHPAAAACRPGTWLIATARGVPLVVVR